jgi:hypothetical protein
MTYSTDEDKTFAFTSRRLRTSKKLLSQVH